MWLWFSYDRGFNPYDEGNAIYPAVRILNGEMPHRDFNTLYTGGVYYFYAALFSVFGIHAGVVRIATALLVGLVAVMTVRIAARFMNGAWSFLPGIIFLLAYPLNPTSYHSWYAVLFGIFALISVLRYLDTGLLRFLLPAGLAAGGGFLAKQTMGAFILSALVGVLIWYFPLVKDPKRDGWDRFLRGFCFLIAAAAYTIYLEPAWTRGAHVGYLFLTPLWLIPLTVWILGLPGDTDENTRTSRPYPSVLHALGMVIAGCAIPLVIYTVYYLWHNGGSALLYGVFQFPGRYLETWVSQSSFPRPLSWVLDPLGTFLILLLVPAWGIAQRWGHGVFLRFLLWPLICLALLIYPVRFFTDAVAAWTSFSGFLGWANYALFFSVVYYMPVVVPWLVIIVLVIEQICPGSFGMSLQNRLGIGTVYLFHIYLLFCVYPMLHPFYMIYMMPTTFIMAVFVAHRLWILTTASGWFFAGWPSRVVHAVRLAALLSIPLTAMGVFFLWGTQYWIGLKQLGDEGVISWDDRVAIQAPRGTWGFAFKPEEAKPIEAVCRYLDTHTDPSDPVFVAAASGPLLMFLAERDTPSRTHFPLGPFDPAEQHEMISAIEQTHTRYIVADWNGVVRDAEILWRFITSRFDLEMDFGEYQVFRRR